MRRSALLLVALLLLGADFGGEVVVSGEMQVTAEQQAQAGFRTRGSCTDGVDCVCDDLSTQYGAQLVWCEDFDHPGMVGSQADGRWDDTNLGGDPGEGSAWDLAYGPDNCLDTVSNGESTPTGVACTNPSDCKTYDWGGAAQCAQVGQSAGCWGNNSPEWTCLDVYIDGDEFPWPDANYAPVFDGQASFAMFQADVQELVDGGLPLGSTPKGWKPGERTFAASTEFAITLAINYAPNIEESGAQDLSWKEFIQFTQSASITEHNLFYGNSAGGLCSSNAMWPVLPATRGIGGQSANEAVFAAADYEVGSASDYCSVDVYTYMTSSPNWGGFTSEFGQGACSNDQTSCDHDADCSGGGECRPIWRCYQGFYDSDRNNDGTIGDVVHRIWVDGVQIQGYKADFPPGDLTFNNHNGGAWNNHHNGNDTAFGGTCPGSCTTEGTFRGFESFAALGGDNGEITQPIPCADIGFDESGVAGEVAAVPVVCGNFIVEPGETCDDGTENGDSGKCNATCDGQVP